MPIVNGFYIAEPFQQNPNNDIGNIVANAVKARREAEAAQMQHELKRMEMQRAIENEKKQTQLTKTMADIFKKTQEPTTVTPSTQPPAIMGGIPIPAMPQVTKPLSMEDARQQMGMAWMTSGLVPPNQMDDAMRALAPGKSGLTYEQQLGMVDAKSAAAQKLIEARQHYDSIEKDENRTWQERRDATRAKMELDNALKRIEAQAEASKNVAEYKSELQPAGGGRSGATPNKAMQITRIRNTTNYAFLDRRVKTTSHAIRAMNDALNRLDRMRKNPNLTADDIAYEVQLAKDEWAKGVNPGAVLQEGDKELGTHLSSWESAFNMLLGKAVNKDPTTPALLSSLRRSGNTLMKTYAQELRDQIPITRSFGPAIGMDPKELVTEEEEKGLNRMEQMALDNEGGEPAPKPVVTAPTTPAQPTSVTPPKYDPATQKLLRNKKTGEYKVVPK